MAEVKLTDEQIIKALECCGNMGACTTCSYDDMGGIDKCMHTLLLDALDLINRQKAEIELLQKMKQLNEAEVERLKFVVKNALGRYDLYTDTFVKEMEGE